MDLVGAVMLVLAVLAMIVSLWHVRGIHQTAKRLEDVHRSLSTRSIGPFPDFFPEIVSLINSAKHNISILCDSPAYACFSDSPTFINYQLALKQKDQDERMKISFTCSGPTHRSMTAVDQFPAEVWDERKKSDSQFNEHLRGFLRLHRKHTPINELDNSEFLKLIEDTELDTLDYCFSQADTRQVEVSIPLHFWLIDDGFDMKAIFAISKSAVEYGFSTTDPKLISALKLMRDQYHNASIPIAADAQSE